LAPGNLSGHGFLNAKRSEEEHQKEAWEETRHKELINAYLTHNGVNDQRKARWKRRPNVPEVVNKPRENVSGYLPLNIAGKRMPPRAMMVRPVAPVRAVKIAQAMSADDRQPTWQPT